MSQTQPLPDTTTQTLPDGTVVTKWLAFGVVIEIRTREGEVSVNGAPIHVLTQQELEI